MPKVSQEPVGSLPPGDLRPIVLAFSARALTEATVASGVRPIAVDHFADQDCQEAAGAWLQIVDWSASGPDDQAQHERNILRQLKELVALLPLDGVYQPGPPEIPGLVAAPAGIALCTRRQGGNPILLGGGTENWPELLAILQEHFPILGPTSDQLALLRCRDFWKQMAQRSKLSFPESRDPADFFPAEGETWLAKPVRGAGGYAILRQDQLAHGESHKFRNRPFYWQREIRGRQLGAHCVFADSGVWLLGITESFSKSDWPAPHEFGYRGSWGRLELSAQQRRRIIELCKHIRQVTQLCGWLQMDFLEDSAGELWLLELNPRWAAGMEVLFNTGINPVEYHLAAWGQSAAIDLSNARQLLSKIASRAFAKAIVYIDQELLLTQPLLDALHMLPRKNYADLPSTSMAEQRLAAGQPLLTVRAELPWPVSYGCPRKRLLGQLHKHRQTIHEMVSRSMTLS